MSSNFAGSLMKVAVPLVKNVLSPLAIIASAFTVDGAIQRKLRGRGAVRARKGITSVNSNEDMNDINKIIKSLENSVILIDRVSETVKHEIEKARRQIYWYVVRKFGYFNVRKYVN